MNKRPQHYSDVETCVEDTLRKIGRRIVLGTPLGLGKANHLVNEFYRRAREDPSIDLQIFTALTLARPNWKSELERRFVEPIADRLFAGYPELAYFAPLKRGELPDNIRVTEFFFQPGSFLDSPLAQRSYMSSNYTHVLRDVLDAGINVLAQLVSKTEENGATRYSLSCNSDLTLDAQPRLREMERQGANVALLEDGRVLSGVGGQYNFVAMAHELEDGRSIIMIRSTKDEGGKLHSNVRWSYGHVTIPRHLRDIVITEYGIADLRGRNDEEVIKALLEVADSRFKMGSLRKRNLPASSARTTLFLTTPATTGPSGLRKFWLDMEIEDCSRSFRSGPT